MHKKVALTNVKKNLVARVKDELVEQIGNNVKQRLNGLTSGAESSMTWAVNQIDIAKDYAIAAYHARLAGSGEVVLDANKSRYSNNIKHLDKMTLNYQILQGFSLSKLDFVLGFLFFLAYLF